MEIVGLHKQDQHVDPSILGRVEVGRADGWPIRATGRRASRHRRAWGA